MACVAGGSCGLIAAGAFCRLGQAYRCYSGSSQPTNPTYPGLMTTGDQFIGCTSSTGGCIDYCPSHMGLCSTLNIYDGGPFRLASGLCPAGTKSGPGAASCTACTCAAGYVSSADGATDCAGSDEACELCPAGYSCAGGGLQASPCTCSMGYASTVFGSTYCSGTAGTCALCPLTSVCTGGSAQPPSASPSPASMSVSRSSAPSPVTPSNAPSSAPGHVVLAYYALADVSCSSVVGYITIPPSCAALDANSNSAFTALRGLNAATDGTVGGQYYASIDLSQGGQVSMFSSLAACQGRLSSMQNAYFARDVDYSVPYPGISTSNPSMPTSCTSVSNACRYSTGNSNHCVGYFRCIHGCSTPVLPSATPAMMLNSAILACGAIPSTSQAGNCTGFYPSGASSTTDGPTCAWINCAAGVSGSIFASYSCSCCSASLFRSLPRTDLVGALVGSAFNPGAGFSVSGSGAANEFSCRQACCNAGSSCSAYAYSPYTSSFFSYYGNYGEANCFLFDNVTGLVPNTMMSSAVLISKYS